MCLTENDVKDFRLIRFFINEILQMSKFKLFVSRDKFFRSAQIFLKFVNVTHNWKIQKLKTLLKNSRPFCQVKLKNWHTFWHVGTPSWKIGTPLARWHVGTPIWIIGTPLVRWSVGTFIGTLALWFLKMRSWHAFGMLARWYMDM